MQISSDPSANQAPSSRGPSVQWIGVQWRGGHYALKLSSLAAVFKTSSSVQTDVPSELDLEVHDGAPVFMRSFAHCFDLSQHPVAQTGQEDMKWALILNMPGSSSMGCRVHQVVGPFWDEQKSASVGHDGQEWIWVQARGGRHA